MTDLDAQTSIVGDYWREQYLVIKRQRDEACIEVERLRMEFHRERTEHAITYAEVERENEQLQAALRSHHEAIGVCVHDEAPCSICGIDA